MADTTLEDSSVSNYTAWRATYQSSEQAARAAFQQLERPASPITEDMARAEFRQWLSQNRASLGRLGDTMAALMEQAAIEVATRFQFVTATLEQTEPQPVATINKNNCLSIDDANRLMRLGPGTKLYVQPPSGEVPEGYALVPTDHLPPAMEAAAIDAAREYMERTGGNCMKTIYRALVTAATPPKPAKPVATDWKAVHDMADEYVASYEFRGDEGDYHPNEQERFLIEDCVAGLMHEVQELVTATQQEREGA